MRSCCRGWQSTRHEEIYFTCTARGRYLVGSWRLADSSPGVNTECKLHELLHLNHFLFHATCCGERIPVLLDKLLHRTSQHGSLLEADANNKYTLGATDSACQRATRAPPLGRAWFIEAKHFDSILAHQSVSNSGQPSSLGVFDQTPVDRVRRDGALDEQIVQTFSKHAVRPRGVHISKCHYILSLANPRRKYHFQHFSTSYHSGGGGSLHAHIRRREWLLGFPLAATSRLPNRKEVALWRALMAIVPPEGLETHQTVAIPRNLAIVATNYSP